MKMCIYVFDSARINFDRIAAFFTSILPMDIMKMCMWVFDGSRNNFDRITTFQT